MVNESFNDSGAAWIYLTIALGLTALAIIYIPLFDIEENYLYPLTATLGADATTAATFKIIWTAIPFVVLISYVWWSFSQAQKRDTYY